MTASPVRLSFAGGAVRMAFALVALLCADPAVLAVNFPALTGRVVDQAHIIRPETRSTIETKLADLEGKSGIQLAVASVPSLEGEEIEPYANELFRTWKLGEKTKNNGVLLLVAPKERKVRIEVGYGLEGTLTDALSNVIITGAIVPRFKVNDYAGGIERGIDGIISVLTTDASEWRQRAKARNDEQQPVFDRLMPLILLALLVFILRFMMTHARPDPRGRRRYLGPAVFLPYGGSSWGGSSGWGSGGGGF